MSTSGSVLSGVCMRSVAALGLAVCVLAAGCGGTSPHRPASSATSARAAGGARVEPAQEVPRPMLVWTPDRLPVGFAARVGALAPDGMHFELLRLLPPRPS